MEPVLLSEEYIFVIDTNKDTTDLCFSLCGYCTGLTGEGKTEHFAQQMSDMFYMEMGIEDDESPKGKVSYQKSPFYGAVIDRLDENDCYSPCSVWLNRNYGSNEAGECVKLTDENYSEYEYPAPLSVGIFFGVEPTEPQIKILKERAMKFVGQWQATTQEELTVEGFRLISHKKYGEEREL